MFALTRLRLSITVIVAAAFAALIALAAFSPPASANHSWGNYHWGRTTNSFALNLGNNLNSTWKPFLETASGQSSSGAPFPGADWSDSSVLDTRVVSSGKDPRKCSPTSGRV